MDCVQRTTRYYMEPGKSGHESDHRSAVDRDYGRVLHSGAFRRLQGKSQVVHTGHADYFRTRLTHSLEVAQIARALAARTKRVDPALAEVGALIHDLGHPPFGHNGEDALKAWMKSRGGFEANAQSFRIVAALEVKFPPSETCDVAIGLNLCRETLRASFKYPWPRGAQRSVADDKFGYYLEEPDQSIAEWVLGGGESDKSDGALLVDLADDIA